MKCFNCGKENDMFASFCNNCGNKIKAPNRIDSQNTSNQNTQSEKVYAQNKNPFIALGLSLIFVGLGQFYNGDKIKGAVMLIGAIITGLMTYTVAWWCFSIWTAIDAYRVAKQLSPLWDNSMFKNESSK